MLCYIILYTIHKHRTFCKSEVFGDINGQNLSWASWVHSPWSRPFAPLKSAGLTRARRLLGARLLPGPHPSCPDGIQGSRRDAPRHWWLTSLAESVAWVLVFQMRRAGCRNSTTAPQKLGGLPVLPPWSPKHKHHMQTQHELGWWTGMPGLSSSPAAGHTCNPRSQNSLLGCQRLPFLGSMKFWAKTAKTLREALCRTHCPKNLQGHRSDKC